MSFTANYNYPPIEGFNTPTPDQVPGYAAAKAAHQLPVVPTTPPQRIPGRTANQIIIHALIIFGAIILLDLILKSFVPAIVIGVIFIIGFVQMFWGIIVSQRRVIEECKVGYTTSRTLITNSRNRRAPLTWAQTNNGPTRTRQSPWNFAGVWYLKNDGSVRNPPNTAAFAPGYYPSPNRQGEFELWTGYCWQGKFRPQP